MLWENDIISAARWCREIDNAGDKRRMAEQLLVRVRPGDVIGVGTGSSSYVFLQCLGEYLLKNDALRGSITVIPSACETRLACVQMGLPVATLAERRPDWSVDGADEIDGRGNMIKGRGGGLFAEKLIMRASPDRYIIGGANKMVDKLGRSFALPVEIFPQALHLVIGELSRLGADEIMLRQARNKDGPVVTENGGLLLDVRFSDIGARLESDIKCISGVIESGLFWGFEPTVII